MWKQCASSGIPLSPELEILDLRRVCVQLAALELVARSGRKRLVAAAVARELFFLEILQVEQRVVRALRGTDQLVELELHRLGIAVLGVLDDEHHQERDNGRGGVDDELPGVAEAEERSAQAPEHDRAHGEQECPWAPRQDRNAARQAGKLEFFHLLLRKVMSP